MAGRSFTVPATVTETEIVALLTNLHGLRKGRYWLLDRPSLIFETTARSGQITNTIHVATGAPLSAVKTALAAAIPGVRVSQPDDEAVDFEYGIELTTTSRLRPLRSDNIAASASAVLAAMQPIGRNQVLRLQWVLAPAPSPRPPKLAPKTSTRQGKSWLWVDPDGLPDGETVRAQRRKQVEPLFMAVGRIAVAGVQKPTAHRLVNRLLAALRRAEAPGVSVRRRALPALVAADRVRRREVPLAIWPMTLNAAELAGVIGIPIGSTPLPGVTTGLARQLPADGARTGIVVARSNYPDSRSAIRLSLEARRQHTLIVGPTGSGKSNLISAMVLQDIADDRGVVVLDPKGDLVTDVASRIPNHRLDDVILVDATDEIAPVGLNLLAQPTNADRELIVDQVVGTMHNLFRSSWGIRTADILRGTLATLTATTAADGSAWTLADIPAVLANPAIRRRLAAQVDDPVVRSFWVWFEGLSEAQRSEVTGPLLNKLRAVLLRPRLRRVLGQSQGLDIAEVIRRRKILLVPLAKGQLGEEAAALLGSLIFAQLWAATLGRSAIPANRRSIFCVYMDEAKDQLHHPVGLSHVLAEARGLGMAMHLATQHLSQFPSDIRTAALADARTKILFRTEHDDATVLARALSPKLTSDDLKGLSAYETVIHSAATDHPFTTTGTTAIIGPATTDLQELRLRSRQRHGTTVEDIDQELVRRQELQIDQSEPEDRFGPSRRRDTDSDNDNDAGEELP